MAYLAKGLLIAPIRYALLMSGINHDWSLRGGSMDQQRPKLAQMMKPILLSSLAALWMSIGAVAWAREPTFPRLAWPRIGWPMGRCDSRLPPGSQCRPAEPTCGCGWRTSTRDSSASLTLPRRCRDAVEASPDDPHCTSACPRHMRRPMMPWPHNVR